MPASKAGRGLRAAWLFLLLLPTLLAAPARLAAQTGEPATPPLVPMPAAPPDVRAGMALYRDHCAACHGPQGRGGGSMSDRLPQDPPSFADAERMRDWRPAEAFEVVTQGRLDRLMPPWEDRLSETERWDAVFGSAAFTFTPSRLLRGREVWGASCAGCHAGAAGEAPGASEVPASAGDGDSAAAGDRATGPATTGDRGTGPAAADVGAPMNDFGWMAARSQADLFALARSPALAAHADLAALPDAALWSALDYARAATFRGYPLADWRADGRAGGRVANGSPGGASASGAVITAVPFGDEATGILPGDPLTATVDASGAYSLTGLLAGPGISYRLVANFAGADYIHPEPVAADGAPVDFRVFDPSPAVTLSARIGQIALVPRPEEGRAEVVEVWVLRNDSDWVRGPDASGETLRFSLPEGAQQARFDDPRAQAAARTGDDYLATAWPIPPGEQQLMLGYSLPYAGDTLELARRLDLDTGQLDLNVVGEGLRVASEALPELRSEPRGGQTVTMASGRDLPAGSRVLARIEGLPEAAAGVGAAMMPPIPAPTFTPELLAALALLVGGAGLAAVLAFPRLRGSALAARRGETLAEERRRLVAAIAALDLRRQAGQISPEAYRDRRAALLDRALAIARAQSEEETG